MATPHSSTPWFISEHSPTVIKDAKGNSIITVSGSNEQSLATASLIVELVNNSTKHEEKLLSERVLEVYCAECHSDPGCRCREGSTLWPVGSFHKPRFAEERRQRWEFAAKLLTTTGVAHPPI